MLKNQLAGQKAYSTVGLQAADPSSWSRRLRLLLCLASTLSAAPATESQLRTALLAKTGAVTLPAGTIEISREITLPPTRTISTFAAPAPPSKPLQLFADEP